MSKLTNSAKGQECQVRIGGICRFETETVVAAHIRTPETGAGQKEPDIFFSYCCGRCHDALDGRVRTGYTRIELEWMHYQGVFRTQKIMLEKGLIKL